MNVEKLNVECVIAIVVLLLIITGCNNSRANQTREAGEITVYTTIPLNEAQGYVRLFQVQYPQIQVELFHEPKGKIVERLYDEQDFPMADLVWGESATALLPAGWHEILIPYTPEGIETIPEEFRDSKNPPIWVGMDIAMSALCVNDDLLTRLELERPADWLDLLNPSYVGHITMPDPTTSMIGYMTIADVLYSLEEDDGWSYLNALNNSIGEYTFDDTKSCEQVAQGKYPIGISFASYIVEQKNNGATIDVIFPTTGSGWDVRAIALVNRDNPNPAAQTFFDWAISEEVMRFYEQNRAITALEVSQNFSDDFPVSQFFYKDISWAAANHLRITQEWIKSSADEP